MALVIVIFLTSIVATLIIGGGGCGSPDSHVLNNGRPLVFAHRGTMNYFVENSAESFINARRVGFKALEIDIGITKDHELVVFHDETCQKLLGIEGSLQDKMWDEIKDLFILYRGKPTSNKVLRLKEILQIYGKSHILYLDIKTGSKVVADQILLLMEQCGAYEKTIIADANLLFLAYIKYRNPRIIVALEGFDKGKEWLYYLIPRDFKPDYYSSFLSEADEDHVRFFKRQGILNKKIVYGVEKNNLSRAVTLGISNVIIDYDRSLGDAENISDLLTIGSKK